MISLISYLLRTYRFRRSIASLIKKGMKIGRHVHIMPGVFFDEAYADLINIGDNCTITSGVRILAHDASMYRDLGYSKIGRVDIKKNTFIGNNAIILPGVSIGPDAIIGAGSVVSEDIPQNSVAAGNPAKIISKKDIFLNKHKDEAAKSVTIDYDKYFEKNIKKDSSQVSKKTYLAGGEKKANLSWLKR